MDISPESTLPPEIQAQNFISDLKKAAELPPGQKPDLTLAGRISSHYRSVPDKMWDIVFPVNTVEDLQLTNDRFNIVDACDAIVAASRPKPPDPIPFAGPEHQQVAENIRLHHQLADTINTKKHSLFLDPLPPEIETDISRENIGSQQWITFKADLLQPGSQPIQVYHTTDTISPKNPTEIFFFRQGGRTVTASYSGLPPDGPQVPEVMVVRIEDKNAQGDLSRTDISSASSGRVTSVEVDGQVQNPRDSTRIITETISQISEFQLSPPSRQEVLANTNPQDLINNILKTIAS